MNSATSTTKEVDKPVYRCVACLSSFGAQPGWQPGEVCPACGSHVMMCMTKEFYDSLQKD